MKILQISPRYFPSLGGVEEVVKQYSERLVKNFGQSVKVLTSDLDSDGSREVNGVAVDRLWSMPYFQRGPFLPVTPALALKLLTDKSDLWHLHANKRFTTDVAATVGMMKKTPFVYSTHAGMFGTTFLGRVHNQTIGKLALGARVVIVGSKFEKNLIIKSGVRVKRFEILNIGVDVEEFKDVAANLKSVLNINNNKVILFVGRLTKHKGLDTLIKALPAILTKVPEALVLAVGPDFGEKEMLTKLAAELKVSDRVVFAGSLDRKKLLSAYKSATVFCLPSRSEAFGIVMIEAMAAGLPVVAANNSAMPEIINDTLNGLLFDTENPNDLADKISLLMSDSNLRQKLISNSAADVAEKYNWQNIVAKLNQIYLEVKG